jgi:DnaK suppressor protein
MPEATFNARIRQLLAQRESELQALLHDEAAACDTPPDVVDFKDAASAEADATVHEGAVHLAQPQLAEVIAARRRLDAGTYGQCVDCGEPIPEPRLLAVPWTSHCTACQSAIEQAATRAA